MFVVICLGLPSPLIAIHLLWVNLVTDSLPAIALGMDPKDPNIMRDKPRDSKEGIFAHGGMRNTLMYGAFLTIGVLITYFFPAWMEGVFSIDGINALYSDANGITGIGHQAQTMAFTTLAFSELFHMIGMSDLKRSFVHIFKDKNYMMLIAFILGVVLQLFVIETPGVQDVFSVATGEYNLDGFEWGMTILFSIFPLIIHELVVFVHWIINKIKKA